MGWYRKLMAWLRGVPPDPDLLPRWQRLDAAQNRVDAGLKPFPNRSDTDYLNTVVGRCGHCHQPIYGGQGIQFGAGGTRCWRHRNSPDNTP